MTIDWSGVVKKWKLTNICQYVFELKFCTDFENDYKMTKKGSKRCLKFVFLHMEIPSNVDSEIIVSSRSILNSNEYAIE